VKSNFYKATMTRLGVPFFQSPSLLDRDSRAFAPWGCVFRGVPAGPDWLRVPEHYLPLRQSGVMVLRPIAHDTFVVECSQFSSKMEGIPFCRSPSSRDKDEQAMAMWGCVVRGELVDPDWIKTRELYLPRWLEGVPVIFQFRRRRTARAQTADCLRPRLPPVSTGDGWRPKTVESLPTIALSATSPIPINPGSKRSLRRIASDTTVRVEGPLYATPTHNSVYKMPWLSWPYI